MLYPSVLLIFVLVLWHPNSVHNFPYQPNDDEHSEVEQVEDEIAPTEADVIHPSNGGMINTTMTGNGTTTANINPPVVERIEIRLVESANVTQETPLIIVDVVKKNGSGVAATIQQAIQQEKSTNYEELAPKPDQSIVLRLRQPNYQSFAFVPFQTNSTAMSDAENGTTSVEQNGTTEQPPIGEMVQILLSAKDKKFRDLKNPEAVVEENEADEEEEDSESERDEFVVNEAAILGEKPGNLSYGIDDGNYSIPVTVANGDGDAKNYSIPDGKLADESQEMFELDGDQSETDYSMEEEAPQSAADGPEDEECLANRAKLSRDTLRRLRAERRRIVQTIRKMNKQQRELCQPDKRQDYVPYRKCPMWRREKFFLYYALMRLTYCGNHERWPPSGRRRRI